jgi:hypothetical protein
MRTDAELAIGLLRSTYIPGYELLTKKGRLDMLTALPDYYTPEMTKSDPWGSLADAIDNDIADLLHNANIEEVWPTSELVNMTDDEIAQLSDELLGWAGLGRTLSLLIQILSSMGD